MFDKKLWQSLLYACLLLLVLISLWKLGDQDRHPNVFTYSVYTSNSSTYAHPIGTLPPDDYHRLIDLRNFTFTVLNLPCNESSPLLLILVHSNPRNFENRRLLRETWAQNTVQVRTVFVTGLVEERRLRLKLEQENERYADLIQGSFVDAYRNMTYKHVMVFKYAIYHCPHVRYILKTDDDVLVNMPLMLNFLTTELSPYGGSRMIFCSVRFGSLAIRSYRSKWRVSFKEYPEKTYPPYCPGYALLYSPDVVFDLYREAQRTRYFWIDDVHITGTLADKIHLSHVDVDKLTLTRKETSYVVKYPRHANKSFLYGAPNIRNPEIRALWDYVRNQDSRVSVIRAIS